MAAAGPKLATSGQPARGQPHVLTIGADGMPGWQIAPIAACAALAAAAATLLLHRPKGC